MSDSRILVVDDDSLARSDLASLLGALGYSVAEAGNVDDAVDALAADRFDLVITELRVPGRLDGASLARIVAAGYPGVPVIMVSGTQPDRDDVAATAAFFAKPLDSNRLCQRIGALLPTRNQTQPL